MKISRKDLWFGWTQEALQPPKMPDFMRERLEREAAVAAGAKQPRKPQKK